MAVSPLTGNPFTYAQFPLSTVSPNKLTKQEIPFGQGALPGVGNVSIAFSSTVSVDTLAFSALNKDGDSAMISVDGVKASESLFVSAQNMSDEDWKKIIDGIKDEYLKQKEYLVKKLLEGLKGEKTDESNQNTVTVTENKDAGNALSNLPEYWNAENTSQRIVDFATSFFSVAGKEGKEYYAMMKDAIEQGFSMARGIMGNMPDEISNLTNDTYKLAMKKLDEWAKTQGIEIEDTGDNA